MYSTANLSSLPSVRDLRASQIAAATLDIVFGDVEWQRCHRYWPKWKPLCSRAEYDSGSGDQVDVVFCNGRAIIKGFDHESPVSPYAREPFGVYPGLYDSTPEELLNLLKDDKMMFEHVTFCVWSSEESNGWRSGLDSEEISQHDGSRWLLQQLCVTPAGYSSYLQDYYEKTARSELVRAVYEGTVLDAELVSALNPSRDPVGVLKEIDSQGLGRQ